MECLYLQKTNIESIINFFFACNYKYVVFKRICKYIYFNSQVSAGFGPYQHLPIKDTS